MIRNIIRRLYFILNHRRIFINGTAVNIPEKFLAHFNVRQNNPMEPELFLFLSRLLKEGDVFIDIGANVGIFSLLASGKVGPKGTVVTMEPNPATFGLMSELIGGNKPHDNLVLLQLAVSDQVGILPLQLNQDRSMLMERASIIHSEPGARQVNVLTNTLDNLIPRGLKADIIKIDVEGAELAVLNGARKAIAEYRPVVCLEVHGLYFSKPEEHVRTVFAFFESFGYSCFNLHKQKSETMVDFISDSGAPGGDPLSGRPLNEMGYGNLIFVYSEGHRSAVSESFHSKH